MSNRHEHVTTHCRVASKHSRGARSDHSPVGLQQNFRFEELSTPPITPEPRAIGTVAVRSIDSQRHHASDGAVDVSRALGSLAAHARTRAPHRPPPHDDQPLDSRRIIPRPTAPSTPVGRVAPVRRESVARGKLDPLPAIKPPVEPQSSRHTPVVLLLRIREVMHATGLSKTSIYRMEASGDFPKRVRLTRSAVAWNEAQVRGWIQNRPVALRPRITRAHAIS